MSSLPLISHHLFVAAAGQEDRPARKRRAPKQSRPDSPSLLNWEPVVDTPAAPELQSEPVPVLCDI